MTKTTISVAAPLLSDPDLRQGGVLTLERADGRSVWRQRFVIARVVEIGGTRHYSLRPVEDTYQGSD